MSHAFADIAFTPSVKAAQQRDGSRAGYARNFEVGAEVFNDRLGDAEAEFIARAAQLLHGHRVRDRLALPAAPRRAAGLPEGAGRPRPWPLPTTPATAS